MQLTTHTDYALRLLIYLAVFKSEAALTVQDAAGRYGISANHLAKVAQNLVQQGYITSQRGRGGGLSLMKDPAEINIGEVVRTIESFNLVECFGNDSMCRIERDCKLATAIDEAREAFLQALDRYTLADLVHPKPKLIKMLGVAR
jgi:Rrf2 family nitric oxide-sensitive transcriptional repressor